MSGSDNYEIAAKFLDLAYNDHIGGPMEAYHHRSAQVTALLALADVIEQGIATLARKADQIQFELAQILKAIQ